MCTGLSNARGESEDWGNGDKPLFSGNVLSMAVKDLNKDSLSFKVVGVETKPLDLRDAHNTHVQDFIRIPTLIPSSSDLGMLRNGTALDGYSPSAPAAWDLNRAWLPQETRPKGPSWGHHGDTMGTSCSEPYRAII